MTATAMMMMRRRRRREGATSDWLAPNELQAVPRPAVCAGVVVWCRASVVSAVCVCTRVCCCVGPSQLSGARTLRPRVCLPPAPLCRPPRSVYCTHACVRMGHSAAQQDFRGGQGCRVCVLGSRVLFEIDAALCSSPARL
jgi:hypothetical protein